MGDISRHFNRSEFACKCGCGFEAVDKELVKIAEKIRERIGPFTPTSACRCLKYNRSIGSKDTSQHVKAMAMDIPIPDDELREKVNIWLNDEILAGRGGIGIYDIDKFLHVDIRRRMARWRQV